MENQEKGLELGFNDVILANKKQLKVISNNIVDKVKKGETDSVEAFVMARKGTELFKELEESLRPYLEKDLKITKGETYMKNSVEFTPAETGIKYDNSACQDVIWNDLNARFEALKAEKSERETFLKAIKNKTVLVDEDTSETWEVYPPIRTANDGFKVSLK